MNIYDFGKITIMPNGDAYANVNQPMLGNIFSHSIYEIIQKEMDFWLYQGIGDKYPLTMKIALCTIKGLFDFNRWKNSRHSPPGGSAWWAG